LFLEVIKYALPGIDMWCGMVNIKQSYNKPNFTYTKYFTSFYKIK